jgi:hypothetical protein
METTAGCASNSRSRRLILTMADGMAVVWAL